MSDQKKTVGSKGQRPTTLPQDQPLAKAGEGPALAARTSDQEVAAFVERMQSLRSLRTGERGRLIFAMDATMSRAPTWDMALALQSEMFSAVEAVGGLDVQLVYFRGIAECRASKWVSAPAALAGLMRTVSCQGGRTQIAKVLAHAASEASRHRVGALVYVGDCMEEEIDRLAAKAGELSLVGIPVFLFQEGYDPAASAAFAEIARLSRGAHCRFDAGAASQLRELLTAVAVYASGGRRALEALTDGRGAKGARQLLAALPPPKRPKA